MGNKILPVSVRLEKSKNWKFDFISEKKNYSLFFFFSIEIEKFLKKILNRKGLNFIKIYIKNTGYRLLYIYVFYKLPIFVFFNKIKFKIKKKNIKIKGKKIRIKKYKKIFKIIIFRKLKIFIFLEYLKKKIKNINKNKLNINLILSPVNFTINFINNNNCYKLKRQIFLKKKYTKISKNFNILYLATSLKEPELISKIIQKFLINRKYHKKFFSFIFKDLKKVCHFNKSFLEGFRIQLKGKLNGKMRSKKLLYKYGKNSLNCLNYPIYYSYLPMKTRYGIFGIRVWLIYKNVKKK